MLLTTMSGPNWFRCCGRCSYPHETILSNVVSGYVFMYILQIMSNLFSFGIEMFSKNIADVGALFSQGVQNGDVRIRTAAIQAVGSYVTSSEYKQHKQFEDLIPSMIQATYEVLLLNEDLGEDCLEVFSDLVEAEFKFLRKHFQALFAGILQIFREKKID